MLVEWKLIEFGMRHKNLLNQTPQQASKFRYEQYKSSKGRKSPYANYLGRLFYDSIS